MKAGWSLHSCIRKIRWLMPMPTTHPTPLRRRPATVWVLPRIPLFGDGNKRAAFPAVGMFLYLNGLRLQTSQAEATVTMLAVASANMSEENFAGGCVHTALHGSEDFKPFRPLANTQQALVAIKIR